MSPAQRSPTDVGTLNRSRQRTGMKGQRNRVISSATSLSSVSPHYSGAYAVVTAKLRRAVSVLEVDVEQSLPRVSVNALGRAVSAFLEEIRLGLPPVDTSSTPMGVQSASGRYGRKVTVELVDPALAARVRANRKEVEIGILKSFKERSKVR